MAMQNLIIKMGRPVLVALITLLSVISSVLIAQLLAYFFGGSLNSTTLTIAFITPCIIAPAASWYVVGLLFKIHRLEGEQRNYAAKDMLTSVMSRRAFFENCETLLKLMERNTSSMTLAFIDVDNFKNINDSFGHTGGDEVLKSFANSLEKHCRDSDVIGRFGGDEFAIAFPNTNTNDSNKVLEKIRLFLSQNPPNSK